MNDTVWSDIVIPLIAAVIGGFATWLGVYITIRTTEKHRKEDFRRLENEQKEDERKRNIPYVRVVLDRDDFGGKIPIACDANMRALVFNTQDSRYEYSVAIKKFFIKNISQNHIILRSITIEHTNYKFEERQLLEPSKIASIETVESCMVRFENEIKNMTLYIEDIYENVYSVELECHSKGPIEESATPNRYVSTVRRASLPNYMKVICKC